MLKLLYQSLRALESPVYDPALVRFIYELKAMCINGEGPEVFSCVHCHKKEQLSYFSVRHGGFFCKNCAELVKAKPISADARYTMQYIAATPVQKLFSFAVSKEVLAELQEFMKAYMEHYVHHTFRALEGWENLG